MCFQLLPCAISFRAGFTAGDSNRIAANKRLQFTVPRQRKEPLRFVRESLPPGAWRYNSTLTLIYFIALFTVFRFNYWLVLLRKGNVLLYQLPGREFSENCSMLQREVKIFHFPWKILAQDTSEVYFVHCHRFIRNIKFSSASKLSTQYLEGFILISVTRNNLSLPLIFAHTRLWGWMGSTQEYWESQQSAQRTCNHLFHVFSTAFPLSFAEACFSKTKPKQLKKTPSKF